MLKLKNLWMATRTLTAATPRQLLALTAACLVALGPNAAPMYAADAAARFTTTTPIKHLVVIFNENISFDHYFGTYPLAANPPGEPRFVAKPGTPTVNGYTRALMTNNPNLNPANGAGATNPFRLDPSQAVTADQDHDYTPEQQAFYVDLFQKVTQTPEYKDYMEKQALKPIFLTGKDMLQFLEEDDALNKQLMTEAGFVAK